jgi:dTMP kinase
VTTREPGGTPIAEKIRQILLEKNGEIIADQTELLLMFAARSQHITQVIQPALLAGHWVLCDRFTDATYAYQGGGRGMDISMIEWLEKTVQHGLTPDLTLLLDASIATGLNRVNERGKLDRFELEQQSFFERVRASYLQRAEQNPQQIKIVNADQTLDKVEAEIGLNIQALLASEK